MGGADLHYPGQWCLLLNRMPIQSRRALPVKPSAPSPIPSILGAGQGLFLDGGTRYPILGLGHVRRNRPRHRVPAPAESRPQRGPPRNFETPAPLRYFFTSRFYHD